jgi:hypothetical protein
MTAGMSKTRTKEMQAVIRVLVVKERLLSGRIVTGSLDVSCWYAGLKLTEVVSMGYLVMKKSL